MNCFVIMPFVNDFDDVYGTIKETIDSLLANRGGTCFRLDDSRPAGRITERLLREIQSAEFCVADVTGNRPNVMWELGYAMALEKPAILITQEISDLSFDIKDLQTIHYDRKHLNQTLRIPLRQVALDTIKISAQPQRRDPLREKDELVGTLLSEIQELKSMLGDVVRSWNPTTDSGNDKQTLALAALEGAWVTSSGSHYYAELVNGELVVPYCFMGNSDLTGVYYGWKQTGDYWFARFVWLQKSRRISGFSFLRQQSIDSLTGAWWSDRQGLGNPSAPPDQKGVPVIWERQKHNEFPSWARQFLDEVRQHGLIQVIESSGF